ncbi:12458_t:CDS:2, partial [Racocetra fulgida]
MKEICNAVGIDTKDRDIVNHSGRSTPITSLFQKGVAMGTTMSITEHKSESSYRIYARPSKQKEDALSLLINSVGTLPANLQEQETLTKTFSSDNSNLMKPFRQPLRKTAKVNLPLHINATKQNPTIGGRQIIRKTSRKDNSYEYTPEENISSAP